MATYGTATSYGTGYGDIIQSINSLPGSTDKKIRIWFEGNHTKSYRVTNPIIADGVHAVNITVNGKSDFYVPPEGRWSDEFDSSVLTEATKSFYATVAGIIPRLTPTGGGSAVIGAVAMDNVDLNYLVNDNCDGNFTGWTREGKMCQAYGGKISLYEYEFEGLPVAKKFYNQTCSSQFIIEIELQCVWVGVAGINDLILKIYNREREPNWFIDICMDLTSFGIYDINDDLILSNTDIDLTQKGIYRFLVDTSVEGSHICQAYVDYGSGFVFLGNFSIGGGTGGMVTGKNLIISVVAGWPM